MSETNQMDVTLLYHAVLRELESDAVTDISPAFYRDLSEFIGGLRRQEFDGIEGTINGAMVTMATELASLLLAMRLEKISKSQQGGLGSLLDEEKFILDSEEERTERTQTILSATINGRSKFLESLSQDHRSEKIVVRFLQDVDEMVGVDLQKYGPFKAEDVATIPYENAQALFSKSAAAKIHHDD